MTNSLSPDGSTDSGHLTEFVSFEGLRCSSLRHFVKDISSHFFKGSYRSTLMWTARNAKYLSASEISAAVKGKEQQTLSEEKKKGVGDGLFALGRPRGGGGGGGGGGGHLECDF